MRLRFWRRAEEEYDEDEWETVETEKPLPPLPELALVVSDVSHDGWHIAALVGEAGNMDYFIRAVAVRRPFVIARPVRSNRSNDRLIDPAKLSPASTTPARKLVVNWAWEPVGDDATQLRFYAKRPRRFGFGQSTRAIQVKLTLKEVAPPRRRTVMRVRSNRIVWQRVNQ